MFKQISIALFLAASTAVAQPQQTGKFGEKVDVNLVLLDAVVTDSRGNQILGLDKDDFVVKENGIAQPIDSVDYFTNRQLLNEPESKAAFKVERVHDQRYFVFFFDKPNSGGAFFDTVRITSPSSSRRAMAGSPVVVETIQSACDLRHPRSKRMLIGRQSPLLPQGDTI